MSTSTTLFSMDHMSTIYAHGPDAKTFLQGQLTCDVNLLTPGKAQPAAYCNLQGRVIALFFLLLWQEGYLLILPKNILASTLKHLKKYAIFSKITWETHLPLTLAGFLEKPSFLDVPLYLCFDDLWIALLSFPIEGADAEAWHYQQMLHGWPDIYPSTQEKFLPHRIGLQNIKDVLNFNKGCYLGQEIIARTHYKATLKHTVYLGESTAIIHPGDDLLDKTGQASLGEIFDVSGTYFLAAIKTDAMKELPETVKILKPLP